MLTQRYGITLLTLAGAFFLSGCIENSDECEAQPSVFCADVEAESEEPCLDGEPGCREISEALCGEQRVRYCRAEIACPGVIPECPDGTSLCEPADEDAECVRTVLDPGPCEAVLFCRADPMCDAELACEAGENLSNDECADEEDGCREITVCGQTGYCRLLDNCLAVPTCEPGEEESDDPCRPDNEMCRSVTECGTTIFCRPEVQCNAYPVCEEGLVESAEPCGDGEVDCTEETACGDTIYCRPEVVCHGLPDCAPGEFSSFDPCADDEEGCRAETECGETIYCRDEGPRPVDQMLEAFVCEPVELPADPFSVLAAEISGDVLYLSVEYSGGCADHQFTACPGDFRESQPVQVPLFLSHDSNNDACDGIETQTLGVDLTWIRDQYRRQYNAENGELIIDLGRGDVERQVYRF